MSQENNNYKIQEIVSVSVPLFKSIRGKYFVGQTDTLYVKKGLDTWAGLVNPYNSDVDLYTNTFTISNFSNEYLTAEIWLNTNLPLDLNISKNVSPTNTAIYPRPQNDVNIKFAQSIMEPPYKGINVYKRIVAPYTTLVGEEDGKFITAPKGNYVIIIKSPSYEFSKVNVAFGWWEKIRCL